MGSPVSKTVISAVRVCVCCMVHMCVDGGKKGERGWNRFHLLSISNAENARAWTLYTHLQLLILISLVPEGPGNDTDIHVWSFITV